MRLRNRQLVNIVIGHGSFVEHWFINGEVPNLILIPVF